MTALRGRERGVGATGRCPDPPEPLVGSGAPTALQAWAEGQPKESPQRWHQRVPGERPGPSTHATAQGHGTKTAAGALECSGRLPEGGGSEARLGEPLDLEREREDGNEILQ